MRRVAIVGSRKYPDMEQVRRYVFDLPSDAVVLTGGADGVDRAAELAAYDRFLKVEIYPAEWERYGRAAGPIRNSAIVAVCTELVAFWDGKSRGTADVVRKAEARSGVVVTVFTMPENAPSIQACNGDETR